MKNISEIALTGLFWGMFGTTIGGILGAVFNIQSNKILSFILEFAAGLMTSIICFELIPETLNYGNITTCLLGITFGIIAMFFCDNLIKNHSYIKSKNNSLLKTGFIILIGLTIHNFPEGLAIGSGFEASNSLGLSLAIAIALHDIPEGISISLPFKKGGMNIIKVISLTALSGITTGLGALVGAIIGNISPVFISTSLAFAAGAMLYIVSCELIPESKNIYHGRFGSMGNITGIILGIIANLYV